MSEEIKKEEITFFSIVRLIRSRIKFIGAFIGVILILVIAYSFVMPHKFTASATVFPPNKSDGGGGLSSFLQSFAGSGGLVLGGIGQGNQTQMFKEILQSRSLAEYIVRDLKLSDNKMFKGLDSAVQAGIIRSMIEIEVERSGLIIVTANVETDYFPGGTSKDRAASLAASIANTAIKGLDKIVREKNISSARSSREYIEETLTEYKKDLTEVEIRLEEFQKENKVLSLDEQTAAILNQVVTLGAELNKAQIDLNIAKQEFEPNSQLVKSYRETVEFLEEQYERVQKGGLVSEDAFSIPLNKLPGLIREYTDLVREKKILEQVILYLETQRHQEAIQEERDIPIVEPLDEAMKPGQRAAPSRKLMILLALVISGGLAVSIVIAHAVIKGRLILTKENIS